MTTDEQRERAKSRRRTLRRFDTLVDGWDDSLMLRGNGFGGIGILDRAVYEAHLRDCGCDGIPEDAWVRDADYSTGYDGGDAGTCYRNWQDTSATPQPAE